MEKEYIQLLKIIEDCSLGKLSRSFEEQKHYVEFDIRNNTLEKKIVSLRQCLGNCDLRKYSNVTIEILSWVKILHEELMTRGKWNDLKASSMAMLIDSDFETLYNVSLTTIFTTKSDFNAQAIFDICMEKLYSKLTTEDFKQYPSLIEVYISMIQEIQESKLVRVNPKSLIFSLLLIDDFELSNKIKGLQCCKIILHRLEVIARPNDLFEVTFQTLNKLFKEKDIEITKLLVECQCELTRILPLDKKGQKMDAILLLVLDEILLDVNFYRKTILLSLLQEIIALHGINCVCHKKSFNLVICDSIDMCTSISIREVMLANILQCTEEWIKYCWAALKYSADQKLLRMMLKILYILTGKEQVHIERIQIIIVSLISSCEKEEQNQIIATLTKPDRSENDIFFERIDIILSRFTA